MATLGNSKNDVTQTLQAILAFNVHENVYNGIGIIFDILGLFWRSINLNFNGTNSLLISYILGDVWRLKC